MPTPVVFLPGVNNVATVWDPVVRALTTDVEPILLDVPARERIELIADDLIAQLPPQFILVGHSFGGMVSLAILDAVPERVLGIALVASRAAADTDAVAQAKLDRAEAARTDGHVDYVLSIGAHVFHPRFQHDSAIQAQRISDVHAYGTERYIAHNIAMAHRPDRTPVLAAATIPKLIVTPSDDLVIASAAQRALAEATGATLVEIPETGHMLPAEQPAQLAQALDGWLATIATASP